ncbi:MAG: PhoH family protein [Bacteroidota bacterium]
MEIVEKKLRLGDTDPLSLFGYNDTNLHLIENKFESSVTVRGDSVIIRGEPREVKNIETVFQELLYMLRKNGKLTTNDVTMVIDLIDGGRDVSVLPQDDLDSVILLAKKDVIRARSPRQKEYYKKVQTNDVVFCIGPAGTGKTYMAVAMAVAALRNNDVQRIILSRPAVEAGESLGFLPGDLSEKVDPYLRPLLDALSEMVSADKLKGMIEKRTIEIIPLAYMRGRTLNNSFIILDEAQNTTITQMKMFLTRLGRNSKLIVTGDITQIDLPSRTASGLTDVQYVLKDIQGIDFVYFDKTDVVRHKLVGEIISAYERDAERRDAQNGKPPRPQQQPIEPRSDQQP